MTRHLLYNVAAFMRDGQPMAVNVQNRATDSWPIHLQIGPGGDDTIDVYCTLEQAIELRDKLAAAVQEATAGVLVA